jgi:protein-L-isoaspartate O-methyltransferase
MSLNSLEMMMADSALREQILNLPLDQAYMLHVLSLHEDDEMDIGTLYWRTSGSIDTEDFLNSKIWRWKKHIGMDVPENPPHDPRRDMTVLEKIRKKELVPFAKYHNVNTSLQKNELLARCKHELAKNPIFHQMLFSLFHQSLLRVAYDDSGEKPMLLVKLGGEAHLTRKFLQERFETDMNTLRDYLNRYLVEAFDLHGSPFEQALLCTDRRNSVEKKWEFQAVADSPIPVPGGVTTSAYGVILWMLTATELKKNDRVLVCGAKGAMTAVLAKHIVGESGEVRIIEWNPDTADWARESITRHGFSENEIEVILQDDVTIGSGDEGHWTSIIMNGSIPKIPYPLLDQLDDENGRLLFFMQNANERSQTCWVVHKNESIVSQKELSKFVFTPIQGKYGWDSVEELQMDYERIKNEQREKSLRERVNRLDELLPYPISRAFSVASNAKTPNDQHKLVIRLFDLLNKYLAFISLAILGREKEMNDNMRNLLNKFSKKAQMGDWVQFLRQVCGESYDLSSINELQSFLKKKTTAESVLKAFLTLQIETGKHDAGKRKSVSVIEFLGQVVSYRNISQDGHGRKRNSTIIERNAKMLQEAFITLMSEQTPITNWELFQVDSNERRIEGGVKFGKRELMGNNFDYISTIEDSESHLANNTIAGGVYICANGEYFTMSPWLAFGEGQHGDEELFVYKSDGKWETYHNSDRYPAEREKSLMTRLIERFPPSKQPLTNKNEGRAVFTEMLALFVDDGLLENREIQKLVDILEKFGLCQDHEDGLEQIKQIVDEEYPDVVFERVESKGN